MICEMYKDRILPVCIRFTLLSVTLKRHIVIGIFKLRKHIHDTCFGEPCTNRSLRSQFAIHLQVELKSNLSRIIIKWTESRVCEDFETLKKLETLSSVNNYYNFPSDTNEVNNLFDLSYLLTFQY